MKLKHPTIHNTNIDFYDDMSAELSQAEAIAGLLIVSPQHVGEEIDKDTLGVSAYALRHKIREVIKILDVWHSSQKA